METNQTQGRILVVEDDRDVTELLRTHCQRLGYEVDIALTGRQALATAQREVPDLVILDLVLPDLHGSEVLRALREHAPTRHCPVVVTSVLDRQDYPDDVDAVLQKPFDRSQLHEAITTAAHRRRHSRH